MALVDHGARLLVTAAPGTGSTALREALISRRGATEVVGSQQARQVGVDAKHATVRQLVEAGVVDPGHGMRIVTTTRNPFDFYVAGVRESVYRRAAPIATRDLRFLPATHGDRAGVVGCAALALDHVLAPVAVDARLAAAAL